MNPLGLTQLNFLLCFYVKMLEKFPNEIFKSLSEIYRSLEIFSIIDTLLKLSPGLSNQTDEHVCVVWWCKEINFSKALLETFVANVWIWNSIEDKFEKWVCLRKHHHVVCKLTFISLSFHGFKYLIHKLNENFKTKTGKTYEILM